MKQHQRSPWWAFVATAQGVLLSAVNTTAIGVALPAVVRHFDASPVQSSWILVAYLLSNTTMILVFGRLADVFDRASLYRFGLWTLTASSLLCGFAPRVEVLISLQLVQGVGSAALISTTVAILTDRFSSRSLGSALAWHTAIVSLCQVIGPVLGGALVHLYGWRAVFWFNVPVGLVALLWATLLLPRQAKHGERPQFDAVGAACYVIGVGGVVVALVNGGPQGWGHSVTLLGIAFAAAFGPLFVITQLRSRAPLIGRGVFRNLGRNNAYLAAFCLSASRSAIVLMVALFVQAATGVGSLEAGLQVFPLALGMTLAAPFSGMWGRWFRLERVTASGAALSALGLFGLAASLSPQMSEATVSACLLTIGLGLGTFMGPNTTLIMRGAPPAQRGVINGVRSTLQNTSYLVSSAVVLSVMVVGMEAQEQAAAFAGTLSQSSGSALARLTWNCRWAATAIGVIALVGAAASWFGGSHRRPAPPPPRS